MNTVDEHLDPCGCCDMTIAAPTLYNRPGLPALAYRIGTHGALLRRMVARLPSQELATGPRAGERPLVDLTSRAPDDPAIALLDAGALMMDILTFYQERIANEGFLRTATERRSLFELACAIGYELSPGVAASAFLAFSVDTVLSTTPTAIVPVGVKVQSMPGPGEQPQTFETTAAITARAEWNALKPRRTRPQELAIQEAADGRKHKLYLLGVSTGFGGDIKAQKVEDMYALDAALAARLDARQEAKPGSVTEAQVVEARQIFLVGANSGLKPGDILLLVGKRADTPEPVTLVRSIGQVIADPELNRTQIDFEEEVTAEPPKSPRPPAFARWRDETIGRIDLTLANLNTKTLNDTVVNTSWSESNFKVFAAGQDWVQTAVAASINNMKRSSSTPLRTLAATAVDKDLPPADPGAFAFRTRLGIFGHNAPNYSSLPRITKSPFHDWDEGEGLSIWKNSRLQSSDVLPKVYYSDADLYLERNVPGLVGNSWVILARPTNDYRTYRLRSASDASIAGFAMSAKSVGLILGKNDDKGTPLLNPDELDVADPEKERSDKFKVRNTTAHVQSEHLVLAELPIEDPIAKGSTEIQLDHMVLDLQVGQPVVITGEQEDLRGVTVSEVLILTDVVHAGGFTSLICAKPGLKYGYVRKSVTINANVARASHGESVTEVLGGGNGAQANQRFTLKKPPLTYTSAAEASGVQSSLALYVDGVQWPAAARLYDLAANDQRFVVANGEDGKTTVLFGDGVSGARLPTGVENVTATYRSGIGLGGMVGAGKLTLLQSRPLGIQSVTNPTPATGAADPESRDSARINAPLTVLTMDRIVSLRDFADFARAFAGIGKARSVALWRGETEWVHVTVAAEAATSDDPATAASPLASHRIDTATELYINLVKVMTDISDPSQRFRVDSYQPIFFSLKAKILRDQRYRWTDLQKAVIVALQNAFTFVVRDFGQAVTAAEVIAVIQQVAGVVAVDLDELYRQDKTAGLSATLPAEMVRWEPAQETPKLAELLLINPFGITLEEMQP